MKVVPVVIIAVLMWYIQMHQSSSEPQPAVTAAVDSQSSLSVTVPEAASSSLLAADGVQSEQAPVSVDDEVQGAASASSSDMSLEEKKQRLIVSSSSSSEFI